MKLRLYLETSTISAYHDERQPLRQRQTHRFWATLSRWEVFISPLVFDEILACSDSQLAERLAELVAGIPSLETDTPEVDELTEHYLESGAFTRLRRDDARHVAAATVAGVDCLVSWNFRHVAREKTRSAVQSANLYMGYNRSIRILTPTDLLGDDDDEDV